METTPLKSAESLLGLLQNNRQIPLLPPDGEDEGKLLEACRNFEAIFVQQLLKEMRKTVPKNGLMPESMESGIYTSMFDEEISKQVSQHGRLGLAEMMFKQLHTNAKKQPEGEKTDGNRFIQLDGNS